jgi:hypothetical protein
MVTSLFQDANCMHCEEMFNDVAFDTTNNITAIDSAHKTADDYPTSRWDSGQIALARYDVAGAPDPAFGIGGNGLVLAQAGPADTIVTPSAVEGRLPAVSSIRF